MKWPKEVRVASRIGKGRYRYDNGAPCCAVGHMCAEFGTKYAVCSKQDKWELAYQKVAYVLCTDRYTGRVEITNDGLSGDDMRALIYNTAWAYLGYTEGQPKKVLAALSKVKRALGETQ